MLRRLINGEIALAFLTASVFWIAVLGWATSFAPSEPEKEACYQAAAKSGRSTDECKSFWKKTTSDPVAAFTLVLAFSTVGLWVATIGLYRTSERQIKLARAEFIASHRPRIVLREVHLEGRDVFFTLVNIGDTDATIVESWMLGEFVPDGTALRPLRSTGHNDLGRIVLGAGEARDLTYDLPGDIGFAIMFPETRRIGIEGPPVFGRRYFTGTIVYEDDRGVRRRSVFRRVWDDASHSFVRMAAEQQREHEHEYSD